MYEIKIKPRKENVVRSHSGYGEESCQKLPIERSRKKGALKTALSLSVVIVISTLLSTVVMHATDDAPFSETLLGFVFGGKGSGELSRCPEGMSYISSGRGSFCIDKYTASVGKNCPNLNPSSQSETAENLSTMGCFLESQPNAMPWRYISQTQAQEACQKAGKFLPSGEQWFYTARGTPSDRPWREEGCNLANNWKINPGPAGLAKDCVSYAGVYDMVGNVWEWVDDVVLEGEMEGYRLPTPGYITSVDTRGVVLETDSDQPDENYTADRLWINDEGVRGVMRGGFHGSGTDGGVYSMHVEMTPDFAGRAVGFRCASETLR